MFLRVQWLAVLLFAAVTLACNNRSSLTPAAPSSPSVADAAASIALPMAVAQSSGGRQMSKQQMIHMFDACDPETFNAALGPGTCSRNGGVVFDMFLEQLGRHQSIGAWHFTPPQASLSVGQQLVAMNQGGETHTFTEVEEYGGGIVPMLNNLTGLTRVAPECSQLQSSDFIRPGGAFREVEEEAGIEKYQCCIHPWMRAEIRVIER